MLGSRPLKLAHVLFFCLASVWCPPGVDALAGPRSSGGMRRKLVDASSNNFPPMNVLRDGRLTGFGRELADAVCAAAGIDVEHLHSDHWVDVLAWLDSGEADFIHDTGYTEERDTFLDYSDPILEMPEVIFVRPDRYDIQTLASLRGKTVACVERHISHQYLQQFVEIRCQVAATPAEAMYLLVSGEADAFVYPKQIALYIAQELRLTDKLKVTGVPLRTLTWSMVVKEGNTDVLAVLNEGIGILKRSGEYDRIYKRWWGERMLAGYSTHELVVFTSSVAGMSVLLVLSVGLLLFNRRLRRNREELRESRQRLSSLFEGIDDTVFVHAWDGRILECNAAACRRLGYSHDELCSMYTRDIDAPEFADGYEERLAKQEVGKRLSCEGIHVTKDGEQLPVDINTSVIEYHGDKAVLAVVRDITERKRDEARRLELEAQLLQSQKLESIGTLAGGVAHEINNPINGIMNYAQLIKDRMPAGIKEAEFADEIIHETNRVAKIVRNLLQFARQEEQHTPAPESVHDLIASTLSLVQTVIRHDHITLTQNIPTDLPAVRCRGQQIQQVLINLLTNARDALNERYPQDDSSKAMSIAASPIGNGKRRVRITVEDNGPGIPAELHDRLFDPFFTTKDRTKGTGLGLAISHGIVEDHGGRLWFESEVGQFTKFHIDLPVWDEGESPFSIA